MQTLEARSQYRNALHCAYRIYIEEGITRFWTGTTPRLTRLVVRMAKYLDHKHCLINQGLQLSGGIVFSSYEAIMRVLRKLD